MQILAFFFFAGTAAEPDPVPAAAGQCRELPCQAADTGNVYIASKNRLLKKAFSSRERSHVDCGSTVPSERPAHAACPLQTQTFGQAERDMSAVQHRIPVCRSVVLSSVVSIVL